MVPEGESQRLMPSLYTQRRQISGGSRTMYVSQTLTLEGVWAGDERRVQDPLSIPSSASLLRLPGGCNNGLRAVEPQ